MYIRFHLTKGTKTLRFFQGFPESNSYCSFGPQSDLSRVGMEQVRKSMEQLWKSMEQLWNQRQKRLIDMKERFIVITLSVSLFWPSGGLFLAKFRTDQSTVNQHVV